MEKAIIQQIYQESCQFIPKNFVQTMKSSICECLHKIIKISFIHSTSFMIDSHIMHIELLIILNWFYLCDTLKFCKNKFVSKIETNKNLLNSKFKNNFNLSNLIHNPKLIIMYRKIFQRRAILERLLTIILHFKIIKYQTFNIHWKQNFWQSEDQRSGLIELSSSCGM